VITACESTAADVVRMHRRPPARTMPHAVCTIVVDPAVSNRTCTMPASRRLSPRAVASRRERRVRCRGGERSGASDVVVTRGAGTGGSSAAHGAGTAGRSARFSAAAFFARCRSRARISRWSSCTRPSVGDSEARIRRILAPINGQVHVGLRAVARRERSRVCQTVWNKKNHAGNVDSL